MIDGIVPKISGTFSSVKAIYSLRDVSTPNYIPNVSFWQSGIDTTAICVDSPNAHQLTCVAVHKRVVLFASHFTTGSLVFRGSDASVNTRTAVSIIRVNLSDISNDISIGILDSDLPATVTPWAVCPASLFTKIVNSNDPIPMLYVNQNRQVSIVETSTHDWTAGNFGYGIPSDPQWDSFYQSLQSGDSGAPLGFAINGVPMLMSLVDTVSVWDNFAAINAAIAAALSGASLTAFDISGFPNLVNGVEVVPDNTFVGDGVMNLWATPGNWSLGVAPNSTHRVIIDVTGFGSNQPTNPTALATIAALKFSGSGPVFYDFTNVKVTGGVEVTGADAASGGALVIDSFGGEVILHGPASIGTANNSDSGVVSGGNVSSGSSGLFLKV